ncbi:LOW QUALITY PROTEIN: hypothetical protein HZS_3 [Henneguya salminicola]|nr:LOW QUALITY PROTEIN: hypothetical protein HZS_3 [Henneguya salminicola]
MSIFNDLLYSQDNIASKNCFSSIGAAKFIEGILKNDGIVIPTEIQTRVLPVALRGSDIFACAKTGSGKTLAFAIPLIQRMMAKPKISRTTRALIIIPTRELAFQVCEVIRKLLREPLTVTLIVGILRGQNSKSQESKLRSGSDIIVCTPGRLIDHLYNCPSFCLENIEILVLDEADRCADNELIFRLLDENFDEQLKEIVKYSSKNKQTMLFSATLNDQGLKKLSTRNDYIILIFCDTKKHAHRLFVTLNLLELNAEELHGDMSQDKRNISLDNFRNQKCRILVSTSLSSRGLDISRITLGWPNCSCRPFWQVYICYVHKSSITIISSDERKYWKIIAKGRKSEISPYILDKDKLNDFILKINSIASVVEQKLQDHKIEKSVL